MAYKVINDFYEKEHKNHLYRENHTYPKEGFKADPDRVKYLQSKDNPYEKAFLGEEVKEETDSKSTKSAETKKTSSKK